MAQLTGKFVKALEPVEGENERGRWIRSVFVVETHDMPSRTVALTLFGERRQALVQNLRPGMTVICEYMPESREFGDKWFTDLQCYSIMTARFERRE